MRVTLLEYVRLAMFFGGSAVLVHFVGGFHGQQVIFLGGVFALVAIWLHLLRQVADFKPYRLSIGIDYGALWEDLKLAPADGPKFESIRFTAISSAVFARSDEREYSQILTLYRQIPCGAETWTPGVGQIAHGPSFFFRPGQKGYQFGIHVRPEWWDRHRQQLDSALSAHSPDYSNDLVLGTLPYGYIPEHARRWYEPVSFLYPFDMKQKLWKKTLGQHGWSLDDDYPMNIRHRYLEIGYSGEI
jgi:hypothetical protein